MEKSFYKPVITGRIRFIVFAATAVLGLIFVVCGAVKTVSVKKFKAACTARCEGVVSHVYDRTEEDGKDSYSLNIRYMADSGQVYEFRTRYRSERYEEGDKITVFYDPSDPGKSYSELYSDSSGIHFYIIGGALIIYGILFGAGLIKQRNSD